VTAFATAPLAVREQGGQIDESMARSAEPCVVLKPAFPRFMTRGDTASFGSVVTSQLKSAGSAVVTMSCEACVQISDGNDQIND
jgi:uncharacterized protein YfaS (alpha-2-macroglobulin family)